MTSLLLATSVHVPQLRCGQILPPSRDFTDQIASTATEPCSASDSCPYDVQADWRSCKAKSPGPRYSVRVQLILASIMASCARCPWARDRRKRNDHSGENGASFAPQVVLRLSGTSTSYARRVRDEGLWSAMSGCCRAKCREPAKHRRILWVAAEEGRAGRVSSRNVR